VKLEKREVYTISILNCYLEEKFKFKRFKKKLKVLNINNLQFFLKMSNKKIEKEDEDDEKDILTGSD
jgi:hypothetical protein